LHTLEVDSWATHQAFLADGLHAAHPGTRVSLAVVADLNKLAHLQASRQAGKQQLANGSHTYDVA
jgi:hypothetical protein